MDDAKLFQKFILLWLVCSEDTPAAKRVAAVGWWLTWKVSLLDFSVSSSAFSWFWSLHWFRTEDMNCVQLIGSFRLMGHLWLQTDVTCCFGLQRRFLFCLHEMALFCGKEWFPCMWRFVSFLHVQDLKNAGTFTCFSCTQDLWTP